jgi:hypothetical protein
MMANAQARIESMAEIEVKGGQVSIQLSLLERVGALKSDLCFPLSAVKSVRIVERPFGEIQGIRSPGTRVPAMMALGTWRRRGERDFVAVYRGQRGVVVEIDANQTNYQRIILSTEDPDRVRKLLASAA